MTAKHAGDRSCALQTKVRHRNRCAAGIVALCVLIGCSTSEKEIHFLGDADLSYYKSVATQIDQPLVPSETPEEVEYSLGPRTIRDIQKDELWDLSLVEALHMALANGAVILDNSQFMLRQNQLYANSESTPSVYDPAIQESGILFGRRGVEAALSDFDTRFTSSVLWGRNETVQNTPFFGGLPGSTLTADSAQFRSSLEKQFATGGRITVAHDWDYLGTNALPAIVLFPSSYTGNVRVEYRHPLWAASGTEYTRIAGPAIPGFGPITGVGQGVVIARLNNDITLADFEANVRNLLKDTEDVYYELYLRYRGYHTAVVARNSALRTWRDAKRILDTGGVGSLTPADETRARDRYFETVANVKQALSELYSSEVRLRRLLGLPVNDGRVIRPSDEPTSAPMIPEWQTSLVEALTQRVELRKQKFLIKSLELQLLAATSLTKPQFDFVSSYRVNAFGDTLLTDDDDDGVTAQGYESAYGALTQGRQSGWNLGLTLSMPLGFRQALSQVRNLELRLAKARKVMATQELEISHELATAIQQMEAQYEIAQSNFNRWHAAQKTVEFLEKQLRTGTSTVDEVLRAQSRLALAEQAYFVSLVGYNKGIAEFEFRKGSLLRYNNVYLAESEWTPEAYDDAMQRARTRSHALPNKLLKTEPAEFILPPSRTMIRELRTPESIDPPEPSDWTEPDALEVPPAPAASAEEPLLPEFASDPAQPAKPEAATSEARQWTPASSSRDEHTVAGSQQVESPARR